MTYRELVDEWLERNPIKKWRTKNSLTLQDVAAHLGVSYHSVYRWEKGMTIPDPEKCDLLSRLTGNEIIEIDLKKWAKKRPVFEPDRKEDG